MRFFAMRTTRHQLCDGHAGEKRAEKREVLPFAISHSTCDFFGSSEILLGDIFLGSLLFGKKGDEDVAEKPIYITAIRRSVCVFVLCVYWASREEKKAFWWVRQFYF
jgi:hypothetical protein